MICEKGIILTMSKSSTIIIALLLIIIALLVGLFWVRPAEAPSTPSIITTEPSDTIPSPTTETSAPAPKPLHERVSVTYPKLNASVAKKFTVTGKAPGNWFFEASAPYMLTTPEGDKIAQGHLDAIGDWMTTELVEFKGEVSVNPAYSGPATLVLMKDNPSGMPEHDDSLEIPIVVQ